MRRLARRATTAAAEDNGQAAGRRHIAKDGADAYTLAGAFRNLVHPKPANAPPAPIARRVNDGRPEGG